MPNRILRPLLFITAICILCGTSHAQFLSSNDVNQLPSAAPDHQIAYGDHPGQIADLRLPEGQGPHPVAVILQRFPMPCVELELLHGILNIVL